MNKRLKELRKVLGLTQAKFATRIGSTQNSFANYESGKRNPSGAVINNICKEFNVNEDWLRNGTGDMFITLSNTEKTMGCVARILSDNNEPLKAAFLYAAAEVIDDDTCFEIIKSKLLSIIEEYKSKTE